MKSTIALVATAAALASATFTQTEWVVDVVTVTVTVDADVAPTSTATPTHEPTVKSAPSSAPAPPPPAKAAASSAPAVSSPPPVVTPTPSPEPVSTVTEAQTQAPAPSPSSTQTPSSESIGVSGSFKDVAVNFHNAYRKDHSAGDLEWDDTLAQYAANTANSCVFKHDMNQGNGGYGQNLASFGATGDLGTTESALGKAIADQWYGEAKNYNFYGQANPPPGSDFGSFGHYSQMVWKSSTKVGCATVQCGAGSVLGFPSLYTVCNYSPPGNFDGEYAQNVLPSLGINIDVSI